MEISLTKIGNSNGIILPKALMKKFSITGADTLVIDDDSTELLFRKKTAAEPYSGPNTGFFAALSYHDDGCDDSWGGDKPAEEYVKGLREGLEDKEITGGWR